MHFAIRVLLVLGVAAFLLPESGKASVVFKPGKKPEYVGPGGVEEELSGDAVDLFQIGQAAEKEGNTKRAIRAYKSLVKRHPKDKVAPNALYRAAQLQEQAHLFFAAADSFSQLVEKYPGSPHFDEAIEAQFRIGEIYLNGKKLRFLGIPVASALDRAVTVFANVVRTAPYGKYTARAQLDIGLAREKQGANDAAIQAYQAVVDKFPNEPIAVDAQYQIGYLWFTAAKLRAKFGDAALQPALPMGQASKKKSDMHGARTAESGSAKPGPANNEAPLPTSESDNSLPPPASLSPDTTTAPDPLLAPPGTSTSSSTLPTSEASASPGASASPAP